jgi:NAD(P)-dependent dehydrogenase (short-subunit alcohol dehydrogenase family)
MTAHPNLAPSTPGSAERVAIVTGGSRGIGATVSTAFAEDGTTVVIADVHEAGASLAQELQERGHRAEFVRTDVTSETAVEQLAAHCARRHGRIDFLVNNAGRYRDLGPKRHFTEITFEEWDQVFAVNARGVWLATRAVYPLMRARGFGRVVNIASAVVHLGIPYFAHYVASKGAVIAMTRAIAGEVGTNGITVNAVAPGLVDNEASHATNDAGYLATATQRRAIARPMESADLVGTVRFLCSDASAFITGQTIVVDGGSAFS